MKRLFLLGLALAAGCAGHKHPREAPVEEEPGDGRARSIDPVSANDVGDDLKYVEAWQRGTNLFKVRSGRRLAVLVLAVPTALNGYGGEELWLWDVTNPSAVRGGMLPFATPPTTLQLADISGQVVAYQLRWEARGNERVLRVEGGGSWLELTESFLLLARTAKVRGQAERPDMPGWRRVTTPIGFEYYRSGDLSLMSAEVPLRPRCVVRPYDSRGQPIDAEHPIGDSGFVLVRNPGGIEPWLERRVGGPAIGAQRDPATLFKELRPACVTIRTSRGIGSGSFVTTDGLVVTNAHVASEDALTVALPDGRELRGQVVAREAAQDLALVRVPGRTGDFQAVTFEPAPPDVGTPIVFIGAPAGQEWSFGSGQVSALRRVEDRQLLQLQAPINPGNSGGPVFDLRGRQVGVVVSRRERTPDGRIIESMGFAIPAAVALDFIKAHAR